MGKLKGVKYLLISRIKIFFTVGIIALFLVACAGTGDTTADKEKSTAGKPIQIKVSPEAQKDYDAALEAIRAGKKGKAKSLLKTLV